MFLSRKPIQKGDDGDDDVDDDDDDQEASKPGSPSRKVRMVMMMRSQVKKPKLLTFLYISDYQKDLLSFEGLQRPLLHDQEANRMKKPSQIHSSLHV